MLELGYVQIPLDNGLQIRTSSVQSCKKILREKGTPRKRSCHATKRHRSGGFKQPLLSALSVLLSITSEGDAAGWSGQRSKGKNRISDSK